MLFRSGAVYSLFGPIWSGCRGHHIRVALEDVSFRHFVPESNPLPDYCHLLLGRDELGSALADRVAAHAIEPIVSWVFDDPGINRLFYHQYLELFEASAFALESLRVETDPLGEQLSRILRFRYPRETRFDVTNAEVLLRKGPGSGSSR